MSNTNGGTFTSSGGGAFAKSLYVGTNLTVGGNLTISGTTTSVNSTNVLINDNIIALNSGPSGTGFDSGFLTQRYQIDNTDGTGDVVNDTVEETYALSDATSTTITLPGGANATTDYYKGWWIKITSGTANNHVRQITSYNGTTKVATLVTAFSITPASTNTINLYNKQYSTFVWQEANDRFVTAFTAIDPSAGSVNIIDYANFATNNQNILSTDTSTSSTTGSLQIEGGIGIANATDATSSTNGGTFTSAGGGAFAKALFVGTTLTANTLAGTLSIASQPSITSLGTLTGLTVSSSSSTSIRLIDTGTTSVVNTLEVSHYLSSGTAGVGIGSSMSFRAPNAAGTIISYGKISAISSNVTGGSHAGGLFFASVFNGLYVDSLNLTSSSATNSTLALLGASSTISSANMICSSTLTLGATALTSSIVSVLSGVTAGTATANKVLIVDGSKNITGINEIDITGAYYSAKSAGSASFVSNWPSTSYFGIGADTASADNNMRLGICSISGVWSGYANVKCADINVTDRLTTTASGYGFQHQVSSGAEIVSWASTSFGQFGTLSNHPFELLQNNAVKATIATNGYFGILKRDPSYPLDVSGSATYTTPGSTYRYRNDTGANGSYAGNSVSICARFNSPIAVATEIYVTSDERIKTNINNISNEFAKKFILKVNSVSFNYIKSRGGSFHYGYIAQDLARNGFEDIINLVKDDELEEFIHEDGGMSPKGFCLHVSYQNIIPILGQNIKNIYEDNEKLENRVKNLEDKVCDLEEKNKTLLEKHVKSALQLQDLESRLKKLEDVLLNSSISILN